MIKSSDISVIMAAYNAEKTVDEAIKSVLEQTQRVLELLVVNDCSTDKTEAVIKTWVEKDSRVKLINNTANSGASQSRLNALEVAQGSWIAILDSDDFWKENKIEKQVMGGGTADLIYTGYGFVNKQGQCLDWTMKVPETVDYKTLLKQNVICNSSVLIKKDLYKKYFANDDRLHEDYCIWLKYLKDGNKAVGINNNLVTYRLSSNSRSANKIHALLMSLRTYRAVGLGLFPSFYYLCRNAINGIKKYSHLK